MRSVHSAKKKKSTATIMTFITKSTSNSVSKVYKLCSVFLQPFIILTIIRLNDKGQTEYFTKSSKKVSSAEGFHRKCPNLLTMGDEDRNGVQSFNISLHMQSKKGSDI